MFKQVYVVDPGESLPSITAGVKHGALSHTYYVHTQLLKIHFFRYYSKIV